MNSQRAFESDSNQETIEIKITSLFIPNSRLASNL